MWNLQGICPNFYQNIALLYQNFLYFFICQNLMFYSSNVCCIACHNVLSNICCVICGRLQPIWTRFCDWLIITMKHNKTAVLSSLQRKYDRNDNKQAERCDCVFTMSSIQRKIKRKQKQQHKRKERIRSQYVSSLTLML